ncbi:MAG: energy-coupling factor transporter transmembrane component T [Thermodesulfobacteriota bacterium]|nr:energy-coupling factor transporter transmembrane component T [Thermodesulfobacteriota bacterium]
MNLYLYQDRKTFFHRIDPRTKLFIVMGSFVLTILHRHPLYVLIITALILIHAWYSKSLSNLKKIRWLLIVIGIFSIVVWSFFAKGETFFFGRVSYESLLYGISAALKIDSMIIAGIIFLSTTRNEEIFMGLIRLKIPYTMSFAFSTALRLVPTFIGTGATIVEAQKSRGLNLEAGNIFVRFKNHIPLLVPIFLTSIRSTNQLAMALESKGFGSTKKRTFYFTIGYQKDDLIIILILLILLFLNVILRLNGFGSIPGLTL